MQMECVYWNTTYLLQETIVTRYWRSDIGLIVCIAA